MNNHEETNALYKIEIGKPSWHQRKAGHTSASSIILRLTDKELERYIANLKSKGECYTVAKLPKN